MDSLRNLGKVILVAAVIIALMAVTFFVGYRAGDSDVGIPTSGVKERTAELPPTPSPVPAASRTPHPADLPTNTPSVARASDTPLPTETEQPLPTSTQIPTGTPSPTATDVPIEESVADDGQLVLLDEVWELVEQEFYGDLPSPSERTYGAIRGMLSTLDDDYTSFSEPSIAEILRTDASGSFEGIGAYVTLNEEHILEIAQVFDNSPAEQAGLQARDQVLEVDGESIVGYGIYEAITLIRGPEGSQVVLTIQREGLDPFTVEITRARLDIPIAESELMENGVGYVSLADFSSQAAARLEEAIEGLVAQGATALIFDLRGNPGGFLGQAVEVADLFLDKGVILLERRSDGEEREFPSTKDGLAQSIPLVVLVNGGSASASEIVAGAIQDRARGIIIGETTLGKGSVQMVHTLSDGSELRVTFARWFTPNDHAIHGQGLKPDIEVVLSQEDVESGLDPQLERALEYLLTGS